MFDPDSLEKHIEQKRIRNENRAFWFIVIGGVSLAGLIAAIILALTTDAEAFQGIGTGYYGQGVVVKEEPNRWYANGLEDWNSYSVTDDVVSPSGFVGRETTYFDCSRNFLGEKVCEERQGW